jgi:hypothetical protein
VSHNLGCFDWSLASLCGSASIVLWTLKTSLNVGVPVENLFPVGKDESGLWGGKLVATSQLCL